KVAKKQASGYEIKDEFKLIKLAIDLGIDVKGKKIEEIALKVGEIYLSQFGQQEGKLIFTKRAPLKRQKIWEENEVMPRGVDREIVEALHRTHIGTDQDYLNLMKQATRTALSDGWGGSMIATDLQDVLFGTPEPIIGEVNFGVLKKDYVNIIVHGHEPLLSEMIVIASEDTELINYAKSKGAKGINIGGICCTANEILMRHGISIIGNFLNQEMAITTGAIEVMVVDVQCIMASLPEVASCYHTKIITTSEKAKIPGAIHIQFTEENALEKAKEIIKMAIENFERRNEEIINIPEKISNLVAGFSYESIYYILGGRFRASYKPLNDNIINGRIRGVAGIVGCNNPKVPHDQVHIKLVSKLIENNVLVLQTGCS
ncbi:MAG: carbon monoxide dehydrogenase, partial [Candidatus Ratteibacteria bacterium]